MAPGGGAFLCGAEDAGVCDTPGARTVFGRLGRGGQCWCAPYDSSNHQRAAAWEKGLFLALYVSCGLLGLRSTVDLLPVIGAVFNMLATFQRDEQRTRWLLLVNASIFAVYYVLIGSTVLLSVLCTMASTALGLYRGRGCGAA